MPREACTLRARRTSDGSVPTVKSRVQARRADVKGKVQPAQSSACGHRLGAALQGSPDHGSGLEQEGHQRYPRRDKAGKAVRERQLVQDRVRELR